MTEGYCGPAPVPADLLWRWNLDVSVIAALVLLAFVLWRQAETRVQRQAGAGGIVVLAVLFLSPLCALTVALFSARVAHHALLISVAAPLLALALAQRHVPTFILRWPAAVPLILHALALWFWHAPGPYDAALTGTAGYWAMQVTLGLTALWVWQRILHDPAGPAIFTAFGTMAQMGFLGALLVLSETALYPGHVMTAPAFGLELLDDQRLGGCLMWVPVALPYLAAVLWRLWPLMAPDDVAEETQ